MFVGNCVPECLRSWNSEERGSFFCFGGFYRLSDLFMVLIGSSWKTKRVCLVSEGSDMFCIVPVNSPDSLSWFLSRVMVPPVL